MSDLKACIPITLLVILFVFNLDAYGNGLRFRSNNYLISERTSYNIFNGPKRVYGESITLTFDLSIVNNDFFGHILNVKSGHNQYNMILVNFRDKDRLFIDFNVGLQDKISFPLNKAGSGKYNWHKVVLEWNFAHRQIAISIGEESQVINHSFEHSEDSYHFVFGLFEKYHDVPDIMIKDVEFHDGKKRFYFPLNEAAGDVVHDIYGKSIGSVANPDWVSFYKQHWTLKYETLSDEICGVSFDSITNSLILYQEQETTLLNTQTGAVSKVTNDKSTSFPLKSGRIVPLDSSHVFMYNTRPEAADKFSKAVYNFKTGEITPQGRAEARSKLHHHVVFTDNNAENVYLFGGYGAFKYSNEFLRLNTPDGEDYENVSFTGDSITPRFFSAIGTDFKNGNNFVYLFGGFGNRTGNQEDGGKHYYDLYRIDLSKRHITKLFEINGITENFVPCSNLVLSPQDSSFAVFCYPHHLPLAKGYVYRFAMDGSTYEKVSDSLHILSEKIKTQAFLFPDYRNKEFILVKQEFNDLQASTIQAYTISSYPTERTQYLKANSNSTIILILGIGACCVIGILIIRSVRSKRSKIHETRIADHTDASQELPPEDGEKRPIEQTYLSIRKNAFYLLGEFTVFDRNGHDITHRFSPKILQLFLLVLFNSTADKKGVTTGTLTDLLWPGRAGEKAKNVRGVTVSHLRYILADIDGMELRWERNKWFLEIDDEALFCDYHLIMALTQNEIYEHASEAKYLLSIIELFENGSLLQNYHDRWLDQTKLLFEEKAISILSNILDITLKHNDYVAALRITGLILAIDPLNESIFRIETLSLQGLGKHNQARLKFHLFEKEYFKSYNKRLNMHDFIKDK